MKTYHKFLLLLLAFSLNIAEGYEFIGLTIEKGESRAFNCLPEQNGNSTFHLWYWFDRSKPTAKKELATFSNQSKCTKFSAKIGKFLAENLTHQFFCIRSSPKSCNTSIMVTPGACFNGAGTEERFDFNQINSGKYKIVGISDEINDKKLGCDQPQPDPCKSFSKSKGGKTNPIDFFVKLWTCTDGKGQKPARIPKIYEFIDLDP